METFKNAEEVVGFILPLSFCLTTKEKIEKSQSTKFWGLQVKKIHLYYKLSY